MMWCMCMCMGWGDGARGLMKAHKANRRGERTTWPGGLASSTSGVDTKK